jgi:3-methyladenine DNA glycosylase AlkD
MLSQANVDAAIRAAKGAGSTAGFRTAVRPLARQLRDENPREVAGLAVRICAQGHRFFAYELLEACRAARAALRSGEVQLLGKGIDSWQSVDCFGCFVSGPAWREGQIRDALVHRWARSRDRWWRRAALVSTVPLNTAARRGTGDTARTLGVCELLAADRDDMVVKGLSWALRELSRRDRAAVERFLHKHESTLAARVKREVRNKLRTGLKNPKPNAGGARV